MAGALQKRAMSGPGELKASRKEYVSKVNILTVCIVRIFIWNQYIPIRGTVQIRTFLNAHSIYMCIRSECASYPKCSRENVSMYSN